MSDGSAEGMILRGVWCLVEIEIRSAKTKCMILKNNKLLSINQLKLQAAEKSLATKELVGYR